MNTLFPHSIENLAREIKKVKEKKNLGVIDYLGKIELCYISFSV